jgi:hypothetical protein
LKFHPIAIVGLLLVIVGIVTLIHPQFVMPGQDREVQIGSNKAIITTHRVIAFPMPFSILLVAAGAVQIYVLRRR